MAVDGPLYVLRRSNDGTEQSMRGRSATVGDRVVTVYLRINDKATRTFELTSLVSIDTA
ncbi:MAG: hypothetical protein ABI658_18340 [Acidimicrobiales bacterium]